MNLDAFSAWLVAAVAATAGWFALVGVVAWYRKAGFISPAPAGQALGEESPAIAHLVTNRWECGPDAAEATFVDLAARGYLAIERLGDQPEQALVRVKRLPDEELTEYEKYVMYRVLQVAVDDVVPLPGLAYGTATEARWWLAEFAKEVIADARARGLSRPRASRTVRSTLLAAALVPALFVGIAVAQLINHPAGLIAGLPMLAVLAKASWWIRGERDTAQGRAVAAQWLGVREYLHAHKGFADLPPTAVNLWQRYLAYGAALGVANTTLHVLELGPGDDRYAWSAYSGTWRRVTIGYPRLFNWGLRLDNAFTLGVMWLGWAGLVGWLIGIEVGTAYPRLGALGWISAVLAAGWGLFTITRVVVDFVAPKTIEGQVLHFREQQRRRRAASRWFYTIRYYIAVDDGQHDTAIGYVIPATLRYEVTEDDIVRLTVGRFFGRVRRIDTIQEGWRWRAESSRAAASAA